MTPCNGFKIKGDSSTELVKFHYAQIQRLLSSKVREGVQLLSGGPTFSRGGGSKCLFL